MVGTVMVVGALAEATAWALVAMKKGTVWTVVTPVLGVIGVVTLLVEPPAASERFSVLSAIAIGIATGLGFYVATRVFAFVVRGWAGFTTQSRAMYGRRTPLTLVGAIAVTACVAAPAEELFWRGLFQNGLSDALGNERLLAAVATTAVFVLANVPSWNLAIVLGAVVGGAVWSTLAWWSIGVAAPIACHAVWTALMLAFPVVPKAAEVAV